MKRTIILAAAILPVLTLALAQTRDKKPGDHDAVTKQDSNVAPSQDAYVVAPEAYRREFENEQVRVTRVRYKAREIIESHDHPMQPTVYVYLRDGGPVQFIHTGEEKFTAVRPPVKAGGFRLGRGSKETHRVENLSDQPSEFLRVELKDFKVDGKTFRGRFPPPIRTSQGSKSSEKVGFENQQIRIVRVNCAAREACASNSQTSPYLLVALTSSRLKTAPDNRVFSELKMGLGQTLWVGAGERLYLENPGSTPARFLRIELKTHAGSNPER